MSEFVQGFLTELGREAAGIALGFGVLMLLLFLMAIPSLFKRRK